MTDSTETKAATSRTPSHFAYNVRNREGGDNYWIRIGSAWAHADGKGFNIQLETIPLDGRIAPRYALPAIRQNSATPRPGCDVFKSTHEDERSFRFRSPEPWPEKTLLHGNGYAEIQLDSYTHDQTSASVPDQTSTLNLLALGAAGALAFRQRRGAA